MRVAARTQRPPGEAYQSACVSFWQKCAHFAPRKEDAPDTGNGGLQDVRVHLDGAGHWQHAEFVSTRKDRSAPRIRSDALMRHVGAPDGENRTWSAERRIPATLRGVVVSDCLTTNGCGVVPCSPESAGSNSAQITAGGSRSPHEREVPVLPDIGSSTRIRVGRDTSTGWRITITSGRVTLQGTLFTRARVVVSSCNAMDASQRENTRSRCHRGTEFPNLCPTYTEPDHPFVPG